MALKALCACVCVCVCVCGHNNGPAMAQAVSRWAVITETGFDHRSVHVRLIIDKMNPEQRVVRILWLLSVNIIPPMNHTHLRFHCSALFLSNDIIQ